MSTYDRPWKSFDEQLELLKLRGMLIADDSLAKHHLMNIGYYRLSAYWFPFRQFEMVQGVTALDIKYVRTDQFYSGTTFEDALNLNQFDKNLRSLIFSGLESIEVAIRVDIAHLLGSRDTFAHHTIGEFHPTFANKVNRRSGQSKFEDWHAKYGSLVNRSKEDFVKHYREHHGSQLPIWVAIETWDFGAMSQLYSMMKIPDKIEIALRYGVDWRVFESWLRSLNYLRNLVAHHSRVWNRNIIDQPKMPKLGEVSWCTEFSQSGGNVDRMFVLLAIVGHFLKVVSRDSEWLLKAHDQILSFPEQDSDKKLQVSDIGLVDNWQDWWFA
jgi:abortive infection bacteriophage resistance protein